MAQYTIDTLTDHVINSFDTNKDSRLHEVMSCFVRHMHAAIQEVGLTHEEWVAGLNFLVEVGQFSDENRNEFILLSDHLGVSSLVDYITDQAKLETTSTTGLGPFYIPNQDKLPNGSSLVRHDAPGDPLFFKGKVVGEQGEPIANCEVDIWHSHSGGFYDLQQDQIPNMRGCLVTDENGEFSFTSVTPAGYPLPPDGPIRPLMDQIKSSDYRPAHIHAYLRAPGYTRLVTHLFVPNDKYLDTDPVYAVRDDLIVPFETINTPQGDEPEGFTASPYVRCEFEFSLMKKDNKAAA